jgi:hypothetical protein
MASDKKTAADYSIYGVFYGPRVGLKSPRGKN